MAQNKQALSVTASIDSIQHNGKEIAIFLALQLSNKSADTISYVSMSCSWQEVYTVNRKDLDIDVNPCDKNIPVIEKIFPGKSKTGQLRLKGKITVGDFKKQKLRIGFNWLTVKNFDEMISASSQLMAMKNVIWSNEIMVDL